MGMIKVIAIAEEPPNAMLLHEYARAYNSVNTNGVQVPQVSTGVSYTP